MPAAFFLMAILLQPPQTDVEKMFEACKADGASIRDIAVERTNKLIAEYYSMKNASSLSKREKKLKEEAMRKEIMEKKYVIFKYSHISMPIIDSSECKVFGTPKDEKIYVTRVVDKSSFYGRFLPLSRDSRICLFKGISTKDVVDDSEVEIGFPLYRDGTTADENRVSFRTTYVYRRLTDDEIIELKDMLNAAPTIAPKKTWTGESDELPVEATLVSFDWEFVKLETDESKIIEIEIEKLSKEDQMLVQRFLGDEFYRPSQFK